MSFRWNSRSRTDPGRVRRINEDALLDLADFGLWIVADGMGGHDRGDIASQMVTDTFRQFTYHHSMAQLATVVESQLNTVNRKMIQFAEDQTSTGAMGTTVVAFVAHGSEYRCYWSGDSRAYLLRNQVLKRITHDHSVVQELLDAGVIDPDQADDHPASNQITRAIGMEDPLQLDHVAGSLRDNDKVLLCSDGLYKEVSEDEIKEALKRGSGPAVDTLVDEALQRGARDNVSVIVIEFEENTLVKASSVSQE